MRETPTRRVVANRDGYSSVSDVRTTVKPGWRFVKERRRIESLASRSRARGKVYQGAVEDGKQEGR